MKFRPCIDIHNGSVKQIVGGSLSDTGNTARDNFVSDRDASYFAALYRERNLKGGHIILLNPVGSEYYAADVAQAESALSAWPGGFQLGGGIHPENAERFLKAGASHVIVTSYVFSNGKIDMERLSRMEQAVGKERLVLDLSCRRRGADYFIVTDRWQKFTETRVDAALLDLLSDHCDEYLIHAVDVEGKQSGVETELVRRLGDWGKKPLTYAGGVHSMEDLRLLRELGKDRLDVTVGSALDLFGGTLSFETLAKL